jgi:two-component system, LuxR family, sensor kinase FixL
VRQVFAGENANLAFESIDLDGQRRWLETHAVPMREDGRVATMLAITRDIDERIRMTRQLEEQRNRLHTIIESEPECVKLQHRDGTIFEMNPAGLSLLHAADPQQVIGQNIYDFLTGEYHGAYRQLTQQVFDGEPASMEFQINTLDGQRRWLETHAAPLRDANGEIGALLAITRDIDERKQHEEKLRSHRNQLAHVCRLGTLGELASGLAHELNQPLCAMSSYAESALSMHRRADARNNTRIDDILRKIVTEAERASGIINRLRDLVQRRVPQPQACPVRELIDEVLDIVEPERRRRSFVFQVDVDDALPPVWVDRVQIEQVLINLLYNALQAEYRLPSSVRCIDIDGRLDGEHVTIAIRDYADGIPEDIRDSLFTPFFTTKPNGIGMGLALSRSIAEAHAGTLHYTAKAPGSRFELGLPPKKDDDE